MSFFFWCVDSCVFFVYIKVILIQVLTKQKMDPIVGDFTLTSVKTDGQIQIPAIITTTFPRAIKQNEGYEIALKSIAHAPVKNLVRNHFDLIEKTFTEISWKVKAETHYLSSRFYESQADLLMEIYRILGSLDDPPPMLLYEKNGETTLKFLQHYIDVHADMFLNRPFKYKRRHDETPTTISRKKRALEPHSQFNFNSNLSKVDRLKTLETAVEKLDKEWQWAVMFYKDYENIKEITSSYYRWKNQSNVIFHWDKKMINHEDILKTNNEQFKKFEENLVLLVTSKEYEGDKVNAKIQLDRLNETVSKVMALTQQLQEEQNSTVERLESKIDENNQTMMSFIQILSEQFGNDKTQLLATDTSHFVSRKDKTIVRAKEITVSSKPIVTTRLGFLYCSVVENTLLNNRQTRLLCIFPIISKRGYSFYEVKEAIYKTVSVLQFSTITFTILDSEGDLMEFMLEGDELTNQRDGQKKYPTILNLHIQKRL